MVKFLWLIITALCALYNASVGKDFLLCINILTLMWWADDIWG